jgi:hypothetical protein
MSIIKYIFTPDYTHYEGVRPINIYLLRILYFLMVFFVATDAWTTIINHEGSWDNSKAMSVCVWAAYCTLSVFGLVHPLKWLPIVLFMIFYKSLWLIIVSYPLWRTQTLAGSPAEEMTYIFIAAPFMTLIVPWRYVFKNYVMWSKKPLSTAINR